MEELIPQPFLAERTKFIHGLNIWRKQQVISSVLCKFLIILTKFFLHRISHSCRQLKVPQRQLNQPEISRDKCTATYLLQGSAKGQAILNKYDKTPFLTRTDKKTITQIVVDEFKDRFSKLTSSELEQRSIELSKLFPSEPKVGIFNTARNIR